MMRSYTLNDETQLVPVLRSAFLICVCAILASGCVYDPDFVHPSQLRALKDPLIASIIKGTPFSITRTARPNEKGDLLVEFEWEKYGRPIWFQEFGFGTAASKWRFVLFGPEGKVICGNVWTSTEDKTELCPITKDQMGVPLSADIDFQFPGDAEDDFRSVGRIFYFVEPAPGK